MIKIHFSRPQRGASGAAPLAVRRIGRFPFMALQISEKRPRELDVPFGKEEFRRGLPALSKPHGRGSIYRTHRPARFFCRGMRIRRAGSSPVRQPAGDKRIYHQLLGSGRRCSTIEKASPAAESGQPYDGPVDLLTRGAPPSGLSSP